MEGAKLEGLGLTQLGGLYIEYPSLSLMRRNSFSSPLNSLANILAKAARSVVVPIVVPHWKPSVLERLNPSRYGDRHKLDHCESGLS